MINFEYFRQHAQESGKFAYHILYKDGRFESKKNDLSDLLSIDEDDIVYFEGMWASQEYSDTTDIINTKVNNECLEMYGIPSFGHIENPFKCPTRFLFDFNIMDNLYDLGIDFYKIKKIGELLLKEYKKELLDFSRSRGFRGTYSSKWAYEGVRYYKNSMKWFVYKITKDRLNKALGRDKDL